MGRPGVTYEQVAAVASMMKSENVTPTFTDVRKAINNGSDGTISKHFRKWQESEQLLLQPSSQLPQALHEILNQEFLRLKYEVRAPIEIQLANSMEEAHLLATKNEELEDELVKLSEKIKMLNDEKITISEHYRTLTSENNRLAQDLKNKDVRFEKCLAELGQARNKLETQELTIIEHKQVIRDLQSENFTIVHDKIAAETNLAVYTEKFSAEQEKVRLLSSEKDVLMNQVVKEQRTVEEARDILQKLSSEARAQTILSADKDTRIFELINALETEKTAHIGTKLTAETLEKKLFTEIENIDKLRSENIRLLQSHSEMFSEKCSEISKLLERLATEKGALQGTNQISVHHACVEIATKQSE